MEDVGASSKLQVFYGDKQATQGKHLHLKDVQNEPAFTVGRSKGCRTVFLVDPDAPTPCDQGRQCVRPVGSPIHPSCRQASPAKNASNKRAYLHWLFTFEGDDSDVRDNIVDYMPPSPTAMSGPHRYTFVLFEHSKPIEELDAIKAGITRRKNFDMGGFARDHKLGVPVACDYFVCENEGAHHT